MQSILSLIVYILAIIPIASISHTVEAEQYSREETRNGVVWCSQVDNTYRPLMTPPSRTPLPKDKLVSFYITAEKKKINKSITNLKRLFKRSKSKTYSRRILQLKRKLRTIETSQQWKFLACDEITRRIKTVPTAIPSPIPTTFPELIVSRSISIQTKHSTTFILRDPDLRDHIVSVEPLDTTFISFSCSVVSSGIECIAQNNSFVGVERKEVLVKRLLSSYAPDYQLTRYTVILNAQSNLSNYETFESPSAQQLIAQYIPDQGKGIRPWDRISQGLLASATAGDATAIAYRDRTNNLITRTTGTSLIVRSLPGINVLSHNFLQQLSLCKFLESPILPQTFNWHQLDSNGVPISSGGSYLLRQYTATEIRTVIKDYLVKLMDRYSSFSTWNDGNAQIGLSMMAIPFAEAYSCIRDEIPEGKRIVYENALRTKYIAPTLTLFNNPVWPLNSVGKFDTGNQGIEVAAAFVTVNAILMKETPSESANNITNALQRLDRFLGLLYRGGSLEEGPNYAQRSFESLIRLDEALWNTFGTNFGLITPQSSINSESSLWIYNTFGPGGYRFGFNNATPETTMINTAQVMSWTYGIGHYLAERLQNPMHRIIEAGRLKVDWPPDTAILYYKPYTSNEVQALTPLDYNSSGYPLFASRSSHHPDSLYLGAVGMVHSWIHNYKQPGHYTVHWKGVPFVESLFGEKSSVNFSYDGASYWTQIARRYEIMRIGNKGSNSITLASPANPGYILSNGRPLGYESDTDPTVTFSDFQSTSSNSKAVLDMTKAFHNFNTISYTQGVQSNWQLPTDRFVQQSLRGFGLNREGMDRPYAYVCDTAHYQSNATVEIAFNTPASITTLSANQLRLTYQQPIDNVGGTREVSLVAIVQSNQAFSISSESLNDISSSSLRYPSWWPWSNAQFQCTSDATLASCNKSTHLPNMRRVTITSTGNAPHICTIFAPDTGVSFTPPTIYPISKS